MMSISLVLAYVLLLTYNEEGTKLLKAMPLNMNVSVSSDKNHHCSKSISSCKQQAKFIERFRFSSLFE